LAVASELAKPDWAVYCLPREERPPAEIDVPPAAAPADVQLLLENVAWFCALRWLVIAGLAGLGGLAWLAGGRLPQSGIRLTPGWPAAVAGLLVLLNLGYLALGRAAAGSPRPAVLALRCLWLQIVLDLAVLTGVVHFLGSLETYAPFMYLFHIVLACVFFPYRQSLVVVLAALGMYLACIAAESSGLLPPCSILAVAAGPARSALPPGVPAVHFGFVVFISGTVWYLASRLANALRRREEELAATNRRLVAATDERANHMLRTTHQLKAPFAAIQANTQLLLDGYCGAITEAATNVIRQISVRCEMLSREVKEMLQLANLRSAAQDPPPQVAVDLAALIRACLANLAPAAAKRSVTVAENLAPAQVRAVQDHAMMMLDNILLNAILYSHEGGQVSVECRPKPEGGAVVRVCDRGIGIPADKLPRIFDDYYRTNEAAKHNRASTGLGLAIVRQVALAGRIDVRVQSAPGEGTLFTLDFPAAAGETPETPP
jgi:signal transduction histidine kinase